ncbi:DUF7507 domain-containing protein, partial [Flavobacterium sp. W21_SRS_FM7]
AGINVLDNDLLNGVKVNPADVVISSTPNSPLTVNTDGTVTVAPNTKAGVYTVDYTICEKLNPNNCDTATVTVTVVAPVIDAIDDVAGPITGTTGGNAGINVLDNDLLNGVKVNPADVVISSTANSPLTVNTDGTVTVDPYTEAGVYTVDYTICEKLNPNNCDTATVTVTVVAPVIDAIDDVAGPITGTTAGDAGINVLDNDLLNGVKVNPADVVISSTPNSPLTVNTDGTVTVAPNTKAGVYTVDYTICEKLNPNNCDTATVTVTVVAPVIDAIDDVALAPVNNDIDRIAFTNVLSNDTLNGIAVDPTLVTISFISSTNSGITLVGNDVHVAAGTPAGSYTLVYSICEKVNPTNCDTATVTLNVIQDLPSISILKDGTYVDNDKNGITNVGDIILYNFVVKNTGNVNLTNITITDNNAIVTGGPIANLNVGAVDSTTFTAVHILTQDDINAGYVYNLATVTGSTPNGNNVTATSTDPTPCTTCPIIPECQTCTITELAQNPAIEVNKTAVTENYSAAGDVINYTIQVKNTGNVILYQIVVTDPLTGLNANIASLNPGSTENFTQTYTVTQGDITNGSVTNIAFAKGITSLNKEVNASDDAVVELAFVLGCGAIEVHNAFSPNGDGINEEFVIDNINDVTCYPDNTVEIYNRWGVLVYEAKNYDNTNKVFKGFSEGRTTIKQSVGLPVGTYFYILNYISVDGTGNLVTNKKDGYLYLTR